SEYLEFFAACYDLHGSKRVKVVADVLDLTDLHHKVDAQVAGLSRGMSQRLSIARVLLHDPKVLLMDEPASGLDPRARVEVRELLRELRRIGKTILISSHILSELAELCDSVGIIEQGKLLFAGSTSEALRRADSGLQYEVFVADRHKEAGDLLAKVSGITKVTLVARGDTKVLQVDLSGNEHIDPSEIPARLVTAGFRLVEFRKGEVDLETAFMRLTQGLVS
ncbi:MAG TPA: ABC transporter ATP-binding protein, partial [Phycisphaerales bacterium]|nr:ABC transporter ATP-binding protein [Phycisphaerales bacterium]